MEKPKRIEMLSDEQDDFIKSIEESNLPARYQEIATGLIEFNQWLEFNLQEKNISISRLRKIFGCTSEKQSNKDKGDNKDKKNDEGNELSPDNDATDLNDHVSPDTSEETEEQMPEPPEPSNSRNSGRLSHDAYKNAEIIEISSDYKPGESCPTCRRGKLKKVKPGIVVKITGQSMAKATKYFLGRTRCDLCDQYFTAKLPDDVSSGKYDYRFKSHLCVYKHYLGVPNYRLESYQKYVGVPLPDSTQWDKTEEVANDVFPIYKQLEIDAANSYVTQGDDTGVKILSVMKENLGKDKKSRESTHTTGFVSYNNGHAIHLFTSSKKHAGENIKELLDKRDPDLDRPIYLCDALGSNMPKGLKAILVNCLIHGRRNFVEIENYFPKECTYVLDIFAKIYENESKVKELKLNDRDRMLYHRRHTRPHVKKLYKWINKQLKEKLVEENSSLGKALKYMQRHAARLTRFLRVPGAPLDNNIVERSLKLAIRVRKNSLFYATEHGAFVGSMLQSIIYTCIAVDQNPVEYLTALQENKQKVRSNPTAWMPWNYLDNIIVQQTAA